MGNEIKENTEKLKAKATAFCTCVGFLNEEENSTNLPEIKDAWKHIIRKLLKEFHTLLATLKEEIGWSLLDDQKMTFADISGKTVNALNFYKDFDNESVWAVTNDTLLLLQEGQAGFRQSFVDDHYYERLFDKELDRYAAENKAHLEVIYSQDSNDCVLDYPDEDERKKYMLKKRRKELFETRFGKTYHEVERKTKPTVYHILEQKEQTYEDINKFLSAYLAHQIAQEHCQIKNEAIYKKHIFKDNVDVDKVMKKLDEMIKGKTFTAQRQWYIVYKVFKTKRWLKSSVQARFIDFMSSVFYQKLNFSKADFKKVDSYFKNTDYSEWSLEDTNAPQCCDRYKRIADVLDEEFTEARYAKPGKRINARKIEKFR